MTSLDTISLSILSRCSTLGLRLLECPDFECQHLQAELLRESGDTLRLLFVALDTGVPGVLDGVDAPDTRQRQGPACASARGA